MTSTGADIEVKGELGRVVEAIVRSVDPIEVILFGSQARQEATADSDLDLLVVMPDGTHRRDTTGAIYRTLVGVTGRTRAVDILVTTPTLLARDRGLSWSVVDTATREGRSLYRTGQSVDA